MNNKHDFQSQKLPFSYVTVSHPVELNKIKNIGKGNHTNLLKRWGHSSTVHNGHMYIFAGEVKSSQSSTANVVLKICLEDFENNYFTRTSLSDQQHGVLERDSHSAVVSKDKWINLFGHCGGNSMSQVVAYSFSNRSLSLLNFTGPITPREGHCSCLFADRIILTLGGASVKNNKTISPFNPLPLNVIDLKQKVSTEYPLAKIAGWEHFGSRKDHSISEFNREFYVFGGHALYTKSKSPDEEIFSDLIKIKIDIVEVGYIPKQVTQYQDIIPIDSVHGIRVRFENISYKGPRIYLHSHTSSVLNNSVMVLIGGETYDHMRGIDFVRYNDSVYCYGFEQNCMWEIDTLYGKIPERISHSAAVDESSIYIFGGINNEKELLNDALIITFKFDQKEERTEPLIEEGICPVCESQLSKSIKRIVYASNLKTTEGTVGYASQLFHPDPSLATMEIENEFENLGVKNTTLKLGSHTQQAIEDHNKPIVASEHHKLENAVLKLMEQARLLSYSISDEISAVLGIMNFLKGHPINVTHFPSKIRFEISDPSFSRSFTTHTFLQMDSNQTVPNLNQLNAIASLMYFGNAMIQLADAEIDIESQKVISLPNATAPLVFQASKSNKRGTSLLTTEILVFVLEHFYLAENGSSPISVNGTPIQQKFWGDIRIFLPFNDECLSEYFFERNSDKNLSLFYVDNCLVKFYLLAAKAFIILVIKNFEGDALRQKFSVRLENKLMNLFLRLRLSDIS